MLKVWGRTNSINVQKVLICLDELGLPYSRVDAGLQHGLLDTPGYRAMNPNGVIPTIDDEGFVLWESNVIVRYLTARHDAGGLWPTEPRGRAEADRWMDGSRPPSILLRRRCSGRSCARRTSRRGAISTRRAVPWRRRARFSKRRSGISISLAVPASRWAICALAPSLHRWMHLPVTRPSRPRLEAYYARLMARPSCAKFLVLPLT